MKFDKFKGISEERDVIVMGKTALEFLLDACDRVVDEYKTKIPGFTDKIIKLYLEMHDQLGKELPEYNEQDLTSLVFAKANKDYDNKESKALGLYTGALLHLLTERNKAKGKETRFYINGQGNKFDYLFYFAKEIDELVVDSFIGNDICGYIAHNGRANKIILNNNKGNNIAESAGSYEGNVGILIICNNEGYSAWGAGSFRGQVGLLAINKNKGSNTAEFAGGHKGNIELLIIKDSQGKMLHPLQESTREA